MKRLLLIFMILAAAGHIVSAQEKIILLNEGNWQSDNGKMTYFENGKVVSNQWFRDNNKSKLGDTPNDIIQINDNLIAIAINWSNIVQFITPQGKAVAATEKVPNNRKLATDGKYVYVSSYGHECGTVNGFKYFEKGYVAKIDVKTFRVVDAVEVGYEPEGIAYYKGHLFVANTGGYAFQEAHDYETTVSIIDAATMKVIKNIDTGQINLYGKMSQSGKYLCINSPGDYYNILAATIIFDCEAALKGDEKVFTKLEYAATYNTTARNGKFFAIGSRYSYITNEYKFNYIIIDPALVMQSDGAEGVTEDFPGTVLKDINSMQMPYAIYINPYTGYIYATDAGGFVEAGTLMQWTPEGKLMGKHRVYINPGHLLALPPDGHFTGIRNVERSITATESKTYDIMGREITHPRRGEIVIKNGKKTILK